MRYIVKFLPLLLVVAFIATLAQEPLNLIREKIYSSHSLVDIFIWKFIFKNQKKNTAEIGSIQPQTQGIQEDMYDKWLKENHLKIDSNLFEELINSFEVVKAKVLMYANNNLQKLLVCNKGRLDNVSVNDVVIYKNLLVGIVQKTFDKISVIQPLSDIAFKIPVNIISGSSILKGILVGGYLEDILIVKWVLRKDTVKINSLVYTDQITHNIYIPKNLIIGNVVACREMADFHYKLYVKSAVDFSELKEVYIIKTKKTMEARHKE